MKMETNGNDQISGGFQLVVGKDKVITSPTIGLTKREYFAAMAMQGLLASSPDGLHCDLCSKISIEHADALIEALNK
jgi:hypothetical protein